MPEPVTIPAAPPQNPGASKPDIDLSEFWMEDGSPFKGSGRKMQLALFSYLKENFNIMNVGMRSGALEGPALLGVKTVYLEEKYNLQEDRMNQWQGAVRGFSRVELEHVPTAKGKVELATLIDLTIQSQKDEFKASVNELEYILKENNVTVGVNVSRMIERFARLGIDIEAGTYNPRSTEDVLKDILPKIQGAIGSSIEHGLGADCEDFLSNLKAAIRAYQEWSKGWVKKILGIMYEGPPEGLSVTDTEKIWNAISANLNGGGASGASKSKNNNNYCEEEKNNKNNKNKDNRAYNHYYNNGYYNNGYYNNGYYNNGYYKTYSEKKN